MRKINTYKLKQKLYKLKLKLYKAFARHPNISWFSLRMINFVYTVSLTNYILRPYPFFSLQTLAGIALGLPLYWLVSKKIDKLFGR